jgi:phage terminase large subunit
MLSQSDQGASTAFVKKIQSDPVFHIEKVQGVSTLEEYQKRICRAVAQHERVAIAACHDVGKTYTVSKIVLWLGSSFPGAKIITTAPNATLVEKLLWSEIRDGWRVSKVPLGGRMLTTEWKIREDWFAIGLSPKEDASSGESQGTASNFQGFHGELVVIIFDEATGVPPKRWTQAEGMMTSAKVKWVAIGNPTSSTAEFAKCFKSPAWHKIRLSCFDSPNLPANGITNLEELRREVDLVRGLSEEEQFARMRAYKVVQPKLLTLSWVVAMALKWGMDHPLFVSKVLGEFPAEDDHVLMPLGVVEEAQRRDYAPDPTERFSIGVDVARFGSDKTVITVMHGHKVIQRKTLIKKDGGEVAGEVIKIIHGIDSRNIVVVVDGTGVGSGVVDFLKVSVATLGPKSSIEIREVHFGGGVDTDADKVLYLNQKARMFVRLSSDLKKNMCLPQDSVYLEELPLIIFKFDSKGRYVIESKDEFKKRTGRPSPDDADSLALANEGRYNAAGVGRFSEQMAKSRAPSTNVPGRRSEDQW